MRLAGWVWAYRAIGRTRLAQKEAGMIVKVKTITGKIFSLPDLAPEADIKLLKQKIFETSQVSPDSQKLLYLGNLVSDENQTLKELGLNNGDFLVCLAKRAPPPAPAPERGPTKVEIKEATGGNVREQPPVEGSLFDR